MPATTKPKGKKFQARVRPEDKDEDEKDVDGNDEDDEDDEDKDSDGDNATKPIAGLTQTRSSANESSTRTTRRRKVHPALTETAVKETTAKKAASPRKTRATTKEAPTETTAKKASAAEEAAVLNEAAVALNKAAVALNKAAAALNQAAAAPNRAIASVDKAPTDVDEAAVEKGSEHEDEHEREDKDDEVDKNYDENGYVTSPNKITSTNNSRALRPDSGTTIIDPGEHLDEYIKKHLTPGNRTTITFHTGELGDGNYIIFSKYNMELRGEEYKFCSQTKSDKKNDKLTIPERPTGPKSGLQTLIREYKAKFEREPTSAWITYLHCGECRNLLGLYISPEKASEKILQDKILNDINNCHEVYQRCQLKILLQRQFNIDKNATARNKPTLRKTCKATSTGEYPAPRPSFDGLYHHSSATRIKFSEKE